MSRSARGAALGVIVFCLFGCTPPATQTRGTLPSPLSGEARRLVEVELAPLGTSSNPAPFSGPGKTYRPDGSALNYDRLITVGGLGSTDPEEFDLFVGKLIAAGADVQTLEAAQDGTPTKVLVVLDAQKIVIGERQW